MKKITVILMFALAALWSCGKNTKSEKKVDDNDKVIADFMSEYGTPGPWSDVPTGMCHFLKIEFNRSYRVKCNLMPKDLPSEADAFKINNLSLCDATFKANKSRSLKNHDHSQPIAIYGYASYFSGNSPLTCGEIELYSGEESLGLAYPIKIHF